MMKKQFISTILLGTSFLMSSSVLAETMPIAPLKPSLKAPLEQIVTPGCTKSDLEMKQDISKVCVFDIDETLMFTEKNPDGSTRHVKAAGAEDAINTCIEAGYGIALATASYPDPDAQENLKTFRNYLFEKDMFPQLKKYAKCRAQTSYAKVRKTKINPTYIVGTNGTYYPSNPQPTGANKGEAMDRIMRTYFGTGTGNSFVDDKNPFLQKYKSTHDDKLPNDKGLSGCMVLFDDSRNNEIDIKNYNDVYGTKFQFIRVKDYENPVQKKDPVGITKQNVIDGIEKMEKNCKP